MTDLLRIRPTAKMGLTREQFETIHRTAVELAIRTGFHVAHSALLERMRGRPGFRVSGTRIHPSEERVEAYMRSHRARHDEQPPAPDSPPALYTTDRPLYVVADDHASIRLVTRQDAIDGAKLVAMLHDRGVRGGTIGLPSDVPAWLAPLEQILIALRFGRCGGGSSHIFTLWHSQYAARIARAQGQPFGLSVWMPSPFRLEGNELDIVLAMEGQFESLAVGSMPLMGITAPMNEIKTWIQALAETIGAAAILQELYPGIPVDFWPHPKPADMTTGGYGMGLPEMHLFDVLKSEILPFYGLQPPWGKSACLGAVTPGPQAQLERTAAYVIGCLHGYRSFDMAGVLGAGGDVFSPVQLLLDVETVSWAERYARGATWQADEDEMDRWVRIATSDSLFAEDPGEVAALRSVYREFRFFRPTTAGAHIAEPRNVFEEAKAEVRRLVAAHNVQPDEALLREVEAIVDHARRNPPANA